MDFIVKKEITENDRQDVYQELLKYNLEHLEDKHPQELGVFLENEHGKKEAGLIADTHGNWLLIHYLWVSEKRRGEGLGSRLLVTVEEEARKRGCKYAFVDTFDFQAPGFYIKHDYENVFQLENYPLTGTRFYYTKRL
ncbi:MAG: GNAT family N-acetyltransferase [Clostridiales bacterium]|nr:GNAT family N-acetyltransferase [Roseburia sp.]MDD7635521.1 GNAT family N-acetyltransferase [Clostridiales bacterium]MDY4112575.1 GNAT family N-acetyltransferase [Roseburia sp.]